ncbi:hypothetical protein BH10PSE14_BH10PSE14_39520 [soil metagenome]
MSALPSRSEANGRASMFVSGIVVFGVMAGLSYWPALPQHPFTLKANMLQAGANVIANLLVIAMVLERALAAFNALFFGDEVSSAREDMVANPNSRALESVDLKRERARLILGLAAGFVISAAGVRTLADLVAPPQPDFSAAQAAVDICLTAGLLAGGSNGLARLVDVLKESAAKQVSSSRMQSARDERARRALAQPGA